MSLNHTPSSLRLHIGFFGLRNAGKSSVVNAVTGQELSVVSDVLGTTTDPVKKAMELLPLGPVVIIDTPGIDDEGSLGELRVKKAKQVLTQTDIAVLVVDSIRGLQKADKELIELFKERKIPYVIAYNKCDLLEDIPSIEKNNIYISAINKMNIFELKELIANLNQEKENKKELISDLLNPGDVVVLVIPIDSAAPKGRLILPQQQTIRAILEAGCQAIVCRDIELKQTLQLLINKPKLVITDSQAFKKVSSIVPEDIMLTSFSILFARYKGDLLETVKGAVTLERLEDGDTVLISEGCTHHRQCDDIGTVKLPRWIKEYTNKEINFEYTSGIEYPEDLSKYKLVIHCGGCMLNEKEMKYRIEHTVNSETPITNYGIAIAYINGILKRSLVPFDSIIKVLGLHVNNGG